MLQIAFMLGTAQRCECVGGGGGGCIIHDWSGEKGTLYEELLRVR